MKALKSGSDASALLLARCPAHEVWKLLMVISLNCLYGNLGPPRLLAGDKMSAAQMRVLAHLDERARLFCGPDAVSGEVPCCPPEPMTERLKGKKVRYDGEICTIAHPLTVDQLTPALPPPGTAGRHPLEDGASPELAWFLDEPERSLKPSSEVVRPLPHPKVMATDDEWDRVARVLVDLGVCDLIDESCIPTFEGEEISAGAFGVVKAGKVLPDQRPILRLIMDVRRTNALFHQIAGDLQSISGGPAFMRAVLLEDEVMLISTEDLVASFYLVRMPEKWHRWFAFGKSVSGAVFGLPGRVRICAVVLPMGFTSATGFMQAWHRNVVLRQAPHLHRHGPGLQREAEIRGDRPFPLSATSRPRSGWSIYIDDFLDISFLRRQELLMSLGHVSAHQASVRATYNADNIPRNASKATTGALCDEHVGYLFDGDRGDISLRQGRLLELISIGLQLLGASTNALVLYQLFTGKLAHALQVKRSLWSFLLAFFEVFKEPGPPHSPRTIPPRGRVEVRSLLCCLPLCATRVKGSVDPVITCSDASMDGLGVSRSIGLTLEGWSLFRHGFSRQGSEWTPLPPTVTECREPVVLAIGLFDGIGGLRRSLGRLRLRVALNVSVEKDPRAARVVREAWPGTAEVDDIHDMTRGFLSAIIGTAVELGVRMVVLAGGGPCQDVSRLNRNRVGVSGARSGLFREFIRVATEAREVAHGRDLLFLGVGECTVMDAADEAEITRECGWERTFICAGGMSRVRRPRLYWTSREVEERPWLSIRNGWRGREAVIDGVMEPADLWVLPGWEFPAESTPERIPTFTRAIARWRPPPGAPGLGRIAPHEYDRYCADWRRFPPYTYRDIHCLEATPELQTRSPQPLLARVALAPEREVLMGFLPGHTRRSHKGYTQGVRQPDAFEEDSVRCSLLGNSFHTGAFSVLLGNLFSSMGFQHVEASPTELLERLTTEIIEYEDGNGGTRIVDELIDMESFVRYRDRDPAILAGIDSVEDDDSVWVDFPELFPAKSVPERPPQLREERAALLWLAEAHMRAASSRATEVRTDLNVPLYAPATHRVSIDSRRWLWRHVVSKAVKTRHHINRLELEAVDLAIRWRMRSRARTRRCVHLMDSQVALAVLARGRSASRKLAPAARRIAARTLASGLAMTYGYVRSGLNPADRPSRQT